MMQAFKARKEDLTPKTRQTDRTTALDSTGQHPSGLSFSRLFRRVIWLGMASSSTTAELVLLVDGYLTGAIIGKGGSTLKSIKGASGVHTLQLSQERSSTRTVRYGQPVRSIIASYAQPILIAA